LFCCDDSFLDKRPGAEQLDNGLYSYPQQLVGQRLIDSNLYWINQAGIKVGNHSSGIKYKHSNYIHEDNVIDFFKEG